MRMALQLLPEAPHETYLGETDCAVGDGAHVVVRKNRSISSRCSASEPSGQRAWRNRSQAAASLGFAGRTVIIQVPPPNGSRSSCGALAALLVATPKQCEYPSSSVTKNSV